MEPLAYLHLQLRLDGNEAQSLTFCYAQTSKWKSVTILPICFPKIIKILKSLESNVTPDWTPKFSSLVLTARLSRFMPSNGTGRLYPHVFQRVKTSFAARPGSTLICNIAIKALPGKLLVDGQEVCAQLEKFRSIAIRFKSARLPIWQSNLVFNSSLKKLQLPDWQHNSL